MKWNKGLSKSLSISFFSTLSVELVFDVVKVYPKIETLWPELSILLVPILQLIGTSIALLIIALAAIANREDDTTKHRGPTRETIYICSR